jgi:hypothetical protein
MGWLLTGAEPTADRQAQTETELRLLRLLRELTPDEQRVAMGALEGMKASLTKK